MPVSPALGTARVLATTAGPVHARDTGEPDGHNGHTLVMNPGFLASGDLWLPVVPALHDAGFRVVSIDPPSGSQPEPMRPDADLSPAGMATILGEVVDQLDAPEVTLVANDSGCAITQLLITGDHPGAKKVTRVVFATGDFFENFPPKAFRPLLALPKVPFGVAAMAKALRSNTVWQAPTSFGWLSNEPLPQQIRDAFLGPALEHEGVRRDIAKVLTGIDSSVTLEVAQRLHTYPHPVLFVWAGADRFFPPEHADRAATLFPDATVVKVEGARTFVMWDDPDAVVRAIVGFHG